MLFKELYKLKMSWVCHIGFSTELHFSKCTNIFQNCQLQAIKYLYSRVNNVCLVRNNEIFTVFLKILYIYIFFFSSTTAIFLKQAKWATWRTRRITGSIWEGRECRSEAVSKWEGPQKEKKGQLINDIKIHISYS